MGPMSLHHDKVKQLAAASHGARSSQAAGCDSCVGAVPEGGPALLLGELSAQLTERSTSPALRATSPMRRGFGAPYYCNRDPLRIKRVALWATPTKSQPGDKSFTVCDLVHITVCKKEAVAYATASFSSLKLIVNHQTIF